LKKTSIKNQGIHDDVRKDVRHRVGLGAPKRRNIKARMSVSTSISGLIQQVILIMILIMREGRSVGRRERNGAHDRRYNLQKSPRKFKE